MRRLSNLSMAVRLALFSAGFAGVAGVAEARPIRGPVARAERRVWRAQMALERELTRPVGRARVIEVPAYPVLPGAVPAVGPQVIVPPAVPAPAAQAVVPAPVPTQAAVRPPVPPTAATPPLAPTGVARTAFEAPLPEPVATPTPAALPAPAADGTVSVLVRPEAAPTGAPPAQERSGEPLLFPGAAPQP